MNAIFTWCCLPLVLVVIATAGTTIISASKSGTFLGSSSSSSAAKSSFSPASHRYSQTFFPGDEPSFHLTGFRYEKTAWRATVDQKSSFLTYGPYLTGYPPSTQMQVKFTLSIDNNNHDTARIGYIDVAATPPANHGGLAVLTSQHLIRTDFQNAQTQQEFSLMFRTPSSTENNTTSTKLEFRVFFEAICELTHWKTEVRQLEDGNETSNVFKPFWDSEKHFQFVSKNRFPNQYGTLAGMNVGFYFVTMRNRSSSAAATSVAVVGGEEVVFLFHREYGFERKQPSYCKADYARILVRVSYDGGVTFSNDFSVVATPEPGTPFECAIVDGAAFYDKEKAQWLYLGQCLSRTDVWNMCLFTLNLPDPQKSTSPMVSSGWNAAPFNPSVKSGQLWQTICNANRPSHCIAGSMGSEGTPDIVSKDTDGFFWVTFHGWDPKHGKSARGVAKTKDFQTWLTTGDGLSGDAIFTSVDCNRWNISWAKGGCVGGGEGSIFVQQQHQAEEGSSSLEDDNWMYQLIEAPDITLGCLTKPGEQNWVLGLNRAPFDRKKNRGAFLATGQWEPFRVSPVVVPYKKQGCFIQYHRIWRGPSNTLHLSFWAANYLQIFKLTDPGVGPLPIVAGPPP